MGNIRRSLSTEKQLEGKVGRKKKNKETIGLIGGGLWRSGTYSRSQGSVSNAAVPRKKGT